MRALVRLRRMARPEKAQTEAGLWFCDLAVKANGSPCGTVVTVIRLKIPQKMSLCLWVYGTDACRGLSQETAYQRRSIGECPQTPVHPAPRCPHATRLCCATRASDTQCLMFLRLCNCLSLMMPARRHGLIPFTTPKRVMQVVAPERPQIYTSLLCQCWAFLRHVRVNACTPSKVRRRYNAVYPVFVLSSFHEGCVHSRKPK